MYIEISDRKISIWGYNINIMSGLLLLYVDPSYYILFGNDKAIGIPSNLVTERLEFNHHKSCILRTVRTFKHFSIYILIFFF